MTKTKEGKQPQQVQQPQFSKTAFIEGTEGSDQLILRVILKDGKSYSKEEVDGLLHAWKTKEVKA